jgi:hypothetical protein
MKKALLVLMLPALAFLMSSCMIMQGFAVQAGSLPPGGVTKAVFTLHPASATKSARFQFVMIGVNQPGDIAVGKATWGTNKKFAGPLAMFVSAPLATSLGAQCVQNGLNFNTITGMTWKSFITPHAIGDKGLVAQKAITTVGLKARATATHGDTVGVVGIAGIWVDDGSGTLGPEDVFACTGISSSSIYIQ